MRDIKSGRGRGMALAATGSALDGRCPLPDSDDGVCTAGLVDLERFMGDWFVIASIPTLPERGVSEAVKSYRLRADGTIATTFLYRRGPGGARRTLTARGFVEADSGNAVWGMQFLWPLRADYRIMYVNGDYTQTAIGRSKRDYAWILSRSPDMHHRDFFRHVKRLREQGYDTDRLRIVPQDAAGVAASGAKGDSAPR